MGIRSNYFISSATSMTGIIDSFLRNISDLLQIQLHIKRQCNQIQLLVHIEQINEIRWMNPTSVNYFLDCNLLVKVTLKPLTQPIRMLHTNRPRFKTKIYSHFPSSFNGYIFLALVRNRPPDICISGACLLWKVPPTLDRNRSLLDNQALFQRFASYFNGYCLRAPVLELWGRCFVVLNCPDICVVCHGLSALVVVILMEVVCFYL